MIFSYHISGDWGRPSASIVCRFPRNLWERDTVLAGSVFTLFWDIQLSCCLFHDSGDWGSIPQQAMRGVITGFRGNELPCLLRWIFAPWGISVSEPSGLVFLLTCGSSDSIGSCIFLGRGHRGKAPVKLCIAAFNFQKL